MIGTTNAEAPEVGAHVIPHPGLTWCNRPVPTVPHTVVAVHDYRPALPVVLVTVQPTHVLEHLTADGHPVNPEHGAILDRDEYRRADA